jgi:hypothetical protein
MAYELCRHILTSGRRCEAPSLKESFWCFFHARLHARHRAILYPRYTPGSIELPVLEDVDAIQVAISLTVNALASGKIAEKRAATLFRGLTLAARNTAATLPLPRTSDRVNASAVTTDGLPIARRAMSDNSAPPPQPAPIAGALEKLQQLPAQPTPQPGVQPGAPTPHS